jgi:hypothetical protein
MALLDITEYDNLAYDRLGKVIMVGLEPSQSNIQVAVGSATAQSVALGDKTRFVRLHSDVACRVAFGSNPTASATSMRLGAGSTEYLGVQPGLKIAVIASA